MIATIRNHWENTRIAISNEFPEFSEKQATHAANVVCNFLKKQRFDLWEIYFSKDGYQDFNDGYYAYDNVVACGKIIYLTMRVD